MYVVFKLQGKSKQESGSYKLNLSPVFIFFVIFFIQYQNIFTPVHLYATIGRTKGACRG